MFLSKVRDWWYRKTPIVIHAYTTEANIFERARPLPPTNFMPTWFKKTPSKLNDAKEQGLTLAGTPTIRTCSGLHDLWRRGFIIPMWCDFIIKLGKKGDTDYDWEFSYEPMMATIHPAYQRGEYLPEQEYSHLKLLNPWFFHTEESVDFLWLEATWMQDNPTEYIVPPAVINYRNQSAAHMNLIFPRQEEETEIHIKLGQPLAQLVPLTDRPIKIEYHLATHDEMQAMQTKGKGLKFIGSELATRDNPNRCPMHFLKK